MSLYDLHDQPEGLVDEANWRGIVVDWALAQARDLAASAMAAEDLPAVICALWLAHLQARLNESQQAAQQALLAALTAVQRVAQIKALKSSRSLFAWLGGVGWVVLFGVSVVFVNL